MMEILLIEDRAPDGRSLERRLQPFGTVRWARSLAEVRSMLRDGYEPDFVLTDLHIPDGPSDDLGSMPEVVELFGKHAKIAAITSDVTSTISRQFEQAFRSFRLFDKGSPADLRALTDLMISQRMDESDTARTTLDEGTPASRAWFRAEAIAFCHDLGVPDPITFWLQSRIEATKRCLSWREKALVTVGFGVVAAVALTLINFVMDASWTAFLRGPQQ